MNAIGIHPRLQGYSRKPAEENGWDPDEIPVEGRPLTSREEIETPARSDFPFLEGVERLVDEGGEKTAELSGRGDSALVTGATRVKGVFDPLGAARRPVVFYGGTPDSPATILNLKRCCPAELA